MTARDFPAISVLMPVYNCEPFLDAAVASIRSQTFEDFEFVIVNDGSTDASLQRLMIHQAEDPRIVVLNRPNGGIVDALNAGLARCRGEFIARMDGDDISKPERLAVQIAVLRSHPDVAAVGSDATIIDEVGECKGVVSNSRDDATIRRKLLHGEYAMLHPTLMIRRTAIARIGGYDPSLRYAEDLDLLLRLSDVGKLMNVDAALLEYRKRQNSMSDSRTGVYAQWDLMVLRAAKKRGHAVTATAIAKAYDRLSWSKLAVGSRRDAFSAAWAAWYWSPWSRTGYKSLCRMIPTTLIRN